MMASEASSDLTLPRECSRNAKRVSQESIRSLLNFSLVLHLLTHKIYKTDSMSSLPLVFWPTTILITPSSRRCSFLWELEVLLSSPPEPSTLRSTVMAHTWKTLKTLASGSLSRTSNSEDTIKWRSKLVDSTQLKLKPLSIKKSEH